MARALHYQQENGKPPPPNLNPDEFDPVVIITCPITQLNTPPRQHITLTLSLNLRGILANIDAIEVAHPQRVEIVGAADGNARRPLRRHCRAVASEVVVVAAERRAFAFGLVDHEGYVFGRGAAGGGVAGDDGGGAAGFGDHAGVDGEDCHQGDEESLCGEHLGYEMSTGLSSRRTVVDLQ